MFKKLVKRIKKPKKDYPTKAVLLEKRGNSFAVSEDLAGFFEKAEDGDRIYELRNKEIKTKPIPYSKIYRSKQGKDVVFLAEIDRDNFVPINFNEMKNLSTNEDGEEKQEVIPTVEIDEDVQAWRLYQDRIAKQLHETESGWEKYQPMIVLIVTGLFMVILTYYFMNSVGDMFTQLTDTLKSLSVGAAAAPG